MSNISGTIKERLNCGLSDDGDASGEGRGRTLIAWVAGCNSRSL